MITRINEYSTIRPITFRRYLEVNSHYKTNWIDVRSIHQVTVNSCFHLSEGFEL